MKRVPAFITLTIISLIAAILLAATDAITREPISRAAMSATDGARLLVMPAAEAFEPVENAQGVDSLYTGLVGGQPVGQVATVTVKGFAGDVEVIVGADSQGMLTGISVGGSNFAETAGLGSKAKEPAFTDQFVGKALPVTLGETVDAISGATVTSRAVVDGVNLAATAMGISPAEGSAPAEGAPAEGAVPAETIASSEPAADAHSAATGAAAASSADVAKELPQITGEVKAAGTASASALGYGGPVKVTLSVDAEGLVTALTIGGARFAETEGLGGKVTEEAFTSQFLGKKAPFALADIDAVSSATISSQAAVNAINAAYATLCE